MTWHQQIFAILVSVGVIVFTVEMVRRKKLREEYSVLWLGTACGMFMLVLRYEWLEALTNLIGAVLPTTTLFLGSIIFLVLMAVQFSIKISHLADQVKNLTQENALLHYEVNNLQKGMSGEGEERLMTGTE